MVADDSAGPRNIYRHDQAGRLVAVTDGHGHTQHKPASTRSGNPVEIVERGGAVTRQEFDHRAHLTRRSRPTGDGGRDHLGRRGPGRRGQRLRSGTRPRGGDPAAPTTGGERTPSEIVDPEGGVTRLAVAGGLVTAVTDADGVTVRLPARRRRRSGRGRSTRAGGVTRIERDAAGRPTAVTTPAGRRTELRHDPAGRLVERRDPAGGGVAPRVHRRPGGRTAMVDPTGARTGDPARGRHGEAVELVDAARRGDRPAVTTSFGNLAAVTTRGRGRSRTYTLRRAVPADRLDRTRPAARWMRRARRRRQPERRPSTRPVSATDRPRRPGRAASRGSTTAWSATGYGYDELGRPVAEHRRADGTASGAPATTGAAGRSAVTGGGRWHVPAITTPPAGRLRPDRHEPARPRPNGCRVRRGRPAGHPTSTATGRPGSYRHDPDGLLVERITPAGLTESLARDAAGRVDPPPHPRPGQHRRTPTTRPAGSSRSTDRARTAAAPPRRRRAPGGGDRRARPHHRLHLGPAMAGSSAITDPLGAGHPLHGYDGRPG